MPTAITDKLSHNNPFDSTSRFFLHKGVKHGLALCLLHSRCTCSFLYSCCARPQLNIYTQMLFLWSIRFFICPVYESPKFLVSVGQDDEAVKVIHMIAKRNGTQSSLTLEHLHNAASKYGNEAGVQTRFATWELVKNSFKHLEGKHIKGLFATRRLAWSTSLIIFCYGSLGLAYPLFK